jgi:hypothetical protein
LSRLQAYFDPAVSHAEMRQLNPGVMEDTARFKGEAVRDTLRKRAYFPRTSYAIATAPSMCAGFIGNRKRNCSTKT